MILPWAFGGAFFVFLIVQYMRGIPKELDEAAIFTFYCIWQDFFQPLIFVGSPKNYTISLALNMYTDPNSYNNYGGLFAMSVISLLPVILVFIKFQKYLVEGIATDGIKG